MIQKTALIIASNNTSVEVWCSDYVCTIHSAVKIHELVLRPKRESGQHCLDQA